MHKEKKSIFLNPQNDQTWNKVIENAFQINNTINLEGKKIVIIDDIFTSGATISEIARLLTEAGASEIYGFTLTYGDYQ